MVLKLYDKDLNYLTAISTYRDLKITEELETGYKTAQFSAPLEFRFFEEQKIEIDKYIYVIKEVNLQNNGLYKIYCKPYFGKLSSYFIDSLSGYGMTLQDCLDRLLSNTDWTFQNINVAGAYQINIQRSVVLDAVQAIGKLFQAELKFDTYNKIIYFFNKRGKIADTFILNGSNLGEFNIQSNSYDLITRLIPIGNKGITITAVNNGCSWVENYEYTKEIITAYWFAAEYNNPDDLLKAAQAKIKEISVPNTTYQIFSPFLTPAIEVGDEVRIIDSFRNLDIKKRVVKSVLYPDQPEKNYIELGNLQVSFDKLYKDWQIATSIVEKNTLNDVSILQKRYGGTV